MRPIGSIAQIFLHLWGFLCVRDAGRRGNKITEIPALTAFTAIYIGSGGVIEVAVAVVYVVAVTPHQQLQ